MAVPQSQDCKTQPESVPSGSPHPKFYLVFDLGFASCHPGFHRELVSVWVPALFPAASPLYPPGFPLLSTCGGRDEKLAGKRDGEGSFCMWKRRLSYLSQDPLCFHLSYLTPGSPKSWFPGSHSPLHLYSEKAQKRSGRKGICGLEDFQFSHWGVKGRSRPSMWLVAPLTTLPRAP